MCYSRTIPFQNLIDVILCIEVDSLLIWKMDGQTIDIGRLAMHGKFTYMPAAFDRSDIVCIKVLLDLISVLIYDLDCGSVMAFVNVLVNVLDCLNRSLTLMWQLDLTK